MSFRKRSSVAKPGPKAQAAAQDATVSLPPGLRYSANSGAPITSWGLRSIDAALGGGLPLGSMTVVLEDEPTAYHLPLCSYVVAQGIQAGHSVAVASFDTPAEQLLKNLPACVKKQPGDTGRAGIPLEQRNVTEMKIAWRYQKSADPTTHIVSGDTSRSFAYDFDLSETSDLPQNAAISCLGRGVSASLDALLGQLYSHLEKSARRNLLSRIVIHGLSLAYSGDSRNPADAVARFLCRVRALTRFFGAVAVVSCTEDVSYRAALISSDAAVKIDSFGGRGAGVAGLGKEWLGVLIVKKSYRDGRSPSLKGKGDVWVFKRGRRKYVMERATAAPDEEENGRPVPNKEVHLPNRSASSTAHDAVGSNHLCGTRPDGSGIDF